MLDDDQPGRPAGAPSNGHNPAVPGTGDATPGIARETGEQDPTVVALGRAVARAMRRLDTVDRNLIQLAADVSALRTQLAPAPAGTDYQPTSSPTVRSWLLASDTEQAVKDLAELVDWVGRVYVRFTRAQLSSCWLWHPEVIEELWWLCGAHADAFHSETGSWSRIGDWHDRQRPGVERRVNALLGTCSLTRHVDRNGWVADVGEPAPPALAAHHVAVAAHWTATGTAGPAPTEAVLADAEQAENDQHRGSR